MNGLKITSGRCLFIFSPAFKDYVFTMNCPTFTTGKYLFSFSPANKIHISTKTTYECYDATETALSFSNSTFYEQIFLIIRFFTIH